MTDNEIIKALECCADGSGKGLIINDMPTADVVEVKRGKWIAKDHVSISKRGRIIRYSTYQCPVCRKWNGKHRPSFCPNCGADMRPLDKH